MQFNGHCVSTVQQDIMAGEGLTDGPCPIANRNVKFHYGKGI